MTVSPTATSTLPSPFKSQIAKAAERVQCVEEPQAQVQRWCGGPTATADRKDEPVLWVQTGPAGEACVVLAFAFDQLIWYRHCPISPEMLPPTAPLGGALGSAQPNVYLCVVIPQLCVYASTFMR